MMPNITRGDRMAGLMMYLAGPGRANDHTDQHVVAGHDVIMQAARDSSLSDADTVLDLALLLDQPRRLYGTEVTAPVYEWDAANQRQVKVGEKDAHVWHCSLSLNPSEGPLTDSQWQSIANDFVNEMGFTDPDGGKSCRWVAVRHGLSKSGNDHVHIAVSLVAEDGTKARLHNDQRRAQSAANMLEHKYGLQVLESRESGQESVRGNKPGDLQRAAREGDDVTQRDELRRRLRGAATTARTEVEFVSQARDARVLIRPRFAKGDTSQVVGYSAALVPTVKNGERPQPVWFAASKLDTNLGLGALRERWPADDVARQEAVTAWTDRHERLRSGDLDVPAGVRAKRLPLHVVQQLNESAQQIVIPDRTARFTRVAAVHASGALARASLYFETDSHGPLAKASDVLARSAQASRYDPDDPARQRTERRQLGADFAYVSRLAARAVGHDSAAGWLAVARQISRVGNAVAAAERARGRLAAAQETTAAVDAAVAVIERAEAQRPTIAAPGAVRDVQGATPGTFPTMRPTVSPTNPESDRDRGRG
jgi:hypothetical protein